MTLIKKKEDEFYSPWPRIAAVSLVIALLGTILFTILYLHLQIDWIESLAITFFTTSYHIVIRLLSPLILSLLFHHKYNYQIWWFQPKTWETKLYKGLKVKQWKRQVMVFDPSQFSLKIHSIQEVINNMCHAEVPVTEAYVYILPLADQDTVLPAQILVLSHMSQLHLAQDFLQALQDM